MVGESDSDFVKSVEKLLEVGNTSEAKAVFCNSQHSDFVKDNSWDIIPSISKFLFSQNNVTNSEVFNCSKQLLCHVADVSNPEEAILQFIEEIEEAENDVTFVALLDPLRKVLSRIPKKQAISLAWGFNAIRNYLNKYDFAVSENLQGKEKLLLDNTDESRNINELYKNVLQFYELLIQEITILEEESGQLTATILKFLVEMLGKPLVFQDVEIFDNIKGRSRVCSEKWVPKIFQITSDPISLLSYRFIAENNDVYKLDDLGLASLFYLIFSEHICIEKVPKVYDPVFVFQNSLHLVTVLLKLNHQIVVEKGIKLARSLLQIVSKLNLSYTLLDCADHREFCKSLADVIIYNELENLRKSALEVYKTYLLSFEVKGFYLIIYNLFSSLNHSGLKGYTITMYKDLVVQEFDNPKNDFVRSKKLLAILKKFCFLHKKEESDLVEISDEIIATLNLLRFLTIRDKSNSSQIWDYVPILDELYFKPLTKGLDLSRAHFELKIKELKEDNTVKDKDDINVLIRGESLSKMDKNEKIAVLKHSLTVFDIIESLLSRLVECIELRPKG